MDYIMEIVGWECDLGGFLVCWVLLVFKWCFVGLFIFFDQMGLVQFVFGKGIDVCLYLYIGLVMVIYFFEGVLWYQDSFGEDLVICLGVVNWMIVGYGVVYFEWMLLLECEDGYCIYGIQIWIVLLEVDEDMVFVFYYYLVDSILYFECQGVVFDFILGMVWGVIVLVEVFLLIFYLYGQMLVSFGFIFDIDYEECVFYLVEGDLEFDGQLFVEGSMFVLFVEIVLNVISVYGVCIMICGGVLVGE